MQTKLVAPEGYEFGTVQTEYGNYTIDADNTVIVDSRAVTALLGAGFVISEDQPDDPVAWRGGSHVVTSGEATANEADIDTGLTGLTSFVVMILRSGINVSADATITEADGVITVADNSTDYVLTAGDVINWMALGTTAEA